MPKYTATIRDPGIISRGPEIVVTGTLDDAKRAATREFGYGPGDHAILIYEITGKHSVRPASARRINNRRWADP